MQVKVHPGVQANTIHLCRFKNLFSHLLDILGYPKGGTLKPTNNTCNNHGSPSMPFLGQMFLDVQPTAESMSHHTQFYIFQDTTSPCILLLYAACDCLGILQLQVPNEAPGHEHQFYRTKSCHYKTIFIQKLHRTTSLSRETDCQILQQKTLIPLK